MTAQQLKNAILQEAIQGRLVPQDPNDEPASVLLDRIRKEKQQLVKEGKLKKKDLEEKPISEDEIPFEIPESWEWVRLKDAVNEIADIDHKMPPVSEKGIPYISPLNFRNDGSIDYDSAKKVSEEDYIQLSRKCKPERGDLIFPRYGTIGVIRKVETDINFLVSYSCATIKPHLRNIDSDYIYYVLNSPLIQNAEIKRYVNKTTQPNIGLQSIKLFLFPLPPLAEQKRIVAKIEELLPKVEKYGKAQEKLNKLNEELPERLKKSILQEAIEGRLVKQDPNDEPASVLLDRIRKEKQQLVKEGKLKKKDLEEKPISEDEIPFEIPESWEWVRLITLSKIIHYGYTASASPKGNSKLLRITDIQDDKVNWMAVPFCTIKDNELEKYQLRNRDILIARTGGTIGKTYIVKELKEVAVFASYLIRAIPLENIYEEYLKLFMGSPCYWTQLTDASTGTGQPNVNGQSLSNLIVPLPPLAEQRRIVEKLEQLLGEIDKLKK